MVEGSLLFAVNNASSLKSSIEQALQAQEIEVEVNQETCEIERAPEQQADSIAKGLFSFVIVKSR